MSIVPLGIGRSSVPLQTNRAYANIQNAQSLMLRYEQQMMTQQQYQYGSDSPFNASTTLAVQAQMERKAQNAANINTTQSYLGATDSTLSRINDLTDDVRGMALDAINTTTSASQRNALAQTVKQSIQQVFDFGNYSFQGRYVFAGSTTDVRPFEWAPHFSTIMYLGTPSDLYTWSNTDLLTQTNMNGVDVFGAISNPVRGRIDVDPVVTENTLLRDLNGGRGVDKGAIRISYTLDGITSSFDIDLSRCATVGDVKKAIEQSGNPFCTITVDLTRNGLMLSLPEDTLGALSIAEVGKGKVAAQLGLPTGRQFTSQEPLVGFDIDPVLTATTLLSDILGSNANTTLRFAGANNDILVQANANGETYIDPVSGDELALNGISVALHASTDTLPGQETVEYDADTRQILIHIHPDSSTANNIIDAFNAASAAGTIPPLTASASTTDQRTPSQAGTGIVSLLPGPSIVFGTTSGGSGVQFDPSGFQIVNGGIMHEITFEDCRTVGDFLAKLNDPMYGLHATINAEQNGFDIQTRISGEDFMIGENGGVTATQLGLRTLAEGTQLSELDYGRGVYDYQGPGTNAYATHIGVAPNSGLRITARNEGEYWNDYSVNFVPTSDPDGKALVSIDEDAKTITIGINPGVTTACQVIDAFYEQPGPQQYFDITLDTTLGPNTGEGVVYDGFASTAFGSDGGVDFIITCNDGTKLAIDIHGAETVGDVLRIINGHPLNRDGLIVAQLAVNGNGIELVDTTVGNSVTRVDRTLLSTAAIELGLVNRGEEYRLGDNGLLTGNDPNPKEAESLFNALIRLQNAMDRNDTREIERAVQLLDVAVQRVDMSRAEVGVRQNSLDNVQAHLEEEYIRYEETLNQTFRIDVADVSLGYMAQQLSYQATMQVASAMFRMSLLNYI